MIPALFHRVMCWWRRLPDPFFIELFSGGVLIHWGFYLFCHPAALSGINYDFIDRVVSEPTLIATVKACGLIQVVSVLRRWRWARLGASVLAGTCWSAIAIGIVASRQEVPGIVSYEGYAAMNATAMALLLRRGSHT